MIVTLSEKAELDLQNIGDYISLDNAIRAKSFTRELRLSAQNIGDNPYLYQAYSRQRKNIRRKVHGQYIIYFAIIEETVLILRVVHSARKTTPKDLL